MAATQIALFALIANSQALRSFFYTMLGRSAIHHGGPLSPEDIRILINSPHGSMIKQILNANILHAEMLRQYKLLTNERAFSEMEIKEAITSSNNKERKESKAFSADIPAEQKENQQIKSKHDSMVTHLNDLYGRLDELTLELAKVQQTYLTAQKDYQLLLTQQQSALIKQVHEAGGRLSEPQSAQLQLLSKPQIEKLDDLHKVMREQSKPIQNVKIQETKEDLRNQLRAPMKQIKALSQFFKRSANPTKFLAIINSMRSLNIDRFKTFKKTLTIHHEQRATLQEAIGNISKNLEEKAQELKDVITLITTCEKRVNTFEQKVSYGNIFEPYRPPYEEHPVTTPEQKDPDLEI